MKNVFLWELLRRKMFTIWWSVGISGLIAMTVLSYLALKGQVNQLDKAVSSFTSSGVGSFFGGSDFFSPIGYLSSQIYFILLPLMIIIMVITLASSLMKRDESDLTVELVLSRPVSRTQVLFGKALAGIVIVAVTGIVSYGVMVACVAIAGLSINQNDLFLTHALSFLFAGSFGAIAFALIAFSRFTRGIASVVAILLSLGGYVVSSLSGFVNGLQPVAKALPYHYFNTVDLLSGTVDRGLIIYLVGIYIVAGIVMWIGYVRRDIG
jgi:ABC-2 type transport system permease protein